MTNNISKASKDGLRAGGLKDRDFDKENLIAKKFKGLDKAMNKPKILKV